MIFQTMNSVKSNNQIFISPHIQEKKSIKIEIVSNKNNIPVFLFYNIRVVERLIFVGEGLGGILPDLLRILFLLYFVRTQFFS